ncbi:MAG TPA: hypothetical protein VJ656_14940 [Pyrinomonadaceae bacterium]|nr:hypothetical protein [Pyrinomonadaceae bacterium]
MSQLPRAVILLFVVFASTSAQQAPTNQTDDYLSWSAKQATQIGMKWRMGGRVGWRKAGARAKWDPFYSGVYYYDLRGTLMTPEAIRAAARLEQLRRHLTDDETRALVTEAEKVDGLVAYIELNPREGSGVIPLDWHATLRPKGAKDDSPLAIAGTNTPSLRHIKALTRVGLREYQYDVFWVVFPVRDKQGKPIWETPPDAIELVVDINDMRGRVSWRVNDSFRQRLVGSTQQSHSLRRY